MKTKTFLIIITTLILGSFALSFYYYPQLPETIATHWNGHGEVDGYMEKEAAFLCPAIMIVMTLILTVPAMAEPMSSAGKVRTCWFWFVILNCLFFFCLNWWMLLWNVGTEIKLDFININIILPLSIGILFLVIGYITRKIKRNGFIGIRVPWTLNNDIVWKKTNNFAGWLFMGCGVILISSVLFEAEYFLFFLLIPVMAATIISLIYSYVVHKQVMACGLGGASTEIRFNEGSSDMTWENIKSNYLSQVEKNLMKVNHPAKKQVLEDVASHLDQKYAELDEIDKSWESYQQIITEMGPAEDYAELLNGEAPVAVKEGRSWLFYFLIFDFVAVMTVLGFIVMRGPSSKTYEPSSLETEIFLENLDEKLAGFDIDNAGLEDVVRTFGEPASYIWGQDKVFDRDDLPVRYVMTYPEDFQVFMSDGKVVELRHEGPGTNYAFMGKIKVGMPLEEVLDVFGMPDETVEGKKNQFRDNVLYMDIEGRKGHCYYGRSDRDARLWFLDYEVIAIYTTRSDYGEDRPNESSKALEDRKQSVIDKLAANGNTSEKPIYIVSFKGKGNFNPVTVKELLEAFDNRHADGAKTSYFRTKTENGRLTGHICVNTKKDVESLKKRLKENKKLELISATTEPITQAEFEKHKTMHQLNLNEPEYEVWDIFIRDLRIDSYTKGLYKVTAKIENNSRNMCSEFNLDFYNGDPSVAKAMRHQTGPIEPKKQWNASSLPISLKEGENRITVVLDPDNKIKEKNEGNNVKILLVTIKNGKITYTSTR